MTFALFTRAARNLPALVLFLPTAYSAERMSLEVRETAGIRRFGYPVEAELRFEPPAPAGSRFRLLEAEGGKVIAAQFRPLEEKEGRVVRAALDFEGNFLPHEARKYRVEYGPDVEAAPEPGGLTLEESGDLFRIANGPHLVWEIPRNLSSGGPGGAGLFRSVKSADLDFLRPDSAGLSLRGRDGKLHALRSSGPGKIVKRGPIACRLRFEVGTDIGGGGPVRSTVEVEIPRSKSWARVDWSIDEPKEEIGAMAAEFHLRLEGDTAFADFGTGTLVYAALSKGQAASLRAGPSGAGGPEGKPFWEVLRGPPGKLEPYVAGGPSGAGAAVEGWAHLMDRERCTAAAVAGFAKGSADRIDVDQAGLLRIQREPAAKSLRFWIHFVNFPPHVGAVTSPQSMASPLEVK